MCSADIDNLVISLKISLKAFKYCLVCGTSYNGKIALAFNHFLSSTCFSANQSVFELEILPSVDTQEENNFVKAEHDLHEDEPDPHEDEPDPHEAEFNDPNPENSEEGLKPKDENNSIYDEEARELQNQTENFSPANDDDNFFSDDDEIAPIDGDEPDDLITEDLNSLPRNVVPCDECDSYFSSNIQLNYHRQFTHRESFSCDICEEVSGDLSDLMNHIKSRHKNVVSCFLCQLEIKDIHRHLKSHIGKREFSCSFEGCSQRFVHSESVLKHARVHTAKQFSCRICSMLLAKPASLRNHLSVIHGVEDTFQCGYCLQWFRSHKNLVEHTQSDHSSSAQNKVPCEECGVKFTSKGLQEHLRKKHSKPKKARGRKPCSGKKRKRSGKDKSESSDRILEEAVNREDIITCPKCGAAFNSEEKDLANHHLALCEISVER
ncbi:protein suppressor of hairy wing [Eurytemora carolleeae]|uniref:protein suppressor of hairy wing n=1 Tax=Eurytemora carolleeae TaxID=1294199 RepID=UPI000C76532F|nr:protein suppressor of hairy wing [Eurytemora carolleeae]|eukprot:XP_023333703.1 protein suppressor of hairy wing-like [Eurytemora affinis]